MFSPDDSSPNLSVIVPAYNVGPYVERCVRSILNQTHRDLEVIVVNDCSTDNTALLLTEMGRGDARLKIVSLDVNVGLHAARAAGVDRARGEYLAFVDGDDWIGPEMYATMLTTAKHEVADIVLCGAVIAAGEGRVQGPKVRFPTSEVFNDDILLRFCRLELGSGVIWNKLYRSSVIKPNSLLVLERRVDSGADYIVNFGCFARARRVATLPGPFYFYFHRDNSMSRAPKNGANFALAVRAYVVCLETHAAQGPAGRAAIDELYARQLRYDAYRVTDLRELDVVRGDLSESIKRLAAIHPAGLYSLVHAFDPSRAGGSIGRRRALRQFLAAVKDLARSLLHASTR